MNPLNFILGEKLRQRHLAAELKRSKALTNPKSITPLFDAVAAISKRTGKSGDEITAEHYADESKYPEITAAIAYHKPDITAQAKLTDSLMKTPSKPTTAPTAGTVTAAEFTKPHMTMARSEWSKLTTADKSRFFAEGGKLAEDPAPTKPLSKGGQLTREGLRQLTPRQQNEYFAKGNRLAE